MTSHKLSVPMSSNIDRNNDGIYTLFSQNE